MTRFKANYSIIRFIPNILREEFVNVGVILICSEKGYQGIKTLSDFGKGTKVKALDEKADGNFVRHAMTGLRNAIEHKRVSELIGKDLASNGLLELRGFEVLVGSYQNNIRLTPPKPLLTIDPKATLEEIYKDFVSGKDQESKIYF